MIITLNRHVDRRQDRVTKVTREEWERAMSPFPPDVRYDVANLAAHNWAVHVIDGTYVLTSARWTRGYVRDVAGARHRITDGQQALLYPEGASTPHVDDGALVRLAPALKHLCDPAIDGTA